MPATDLKIGTFVLIPKGSSKKLQPLRKGPYQIIDKPTEVTYKLTDFSIKEIVQHRNNLLPYYPKECALRELTQLYSFTGLHIVQNNPQTEQNQKVNIIKIKKQSNSKTQTLKYQTQQNQNYLKKKEKIEE